MLKIIVQGEELWDESTETFTGFDGFVLELEHSLVSLSKWESKFEKPFLTPGKTTEEVLEYIAMMILNPNPPSDIIRRLSSENLELINTYIDSKQTATTFGIMPKYKGPKEIVTSELIYYWMVGFNIPFECENWHLNRLFALIRVCNVKQSKPKKLSRSEQAQQRRELNAQRRAKLGTSG